MAGDRKFKEETVQTQLSFLLITFLGYSGTEVN